MSSAVSAKKEDVSSGAAGENPLTKADLSDSNVVTKYQKAAEIANQALALVIKSAQPGSLIVDLCAAGDKYVEDECAKVYNKGKIEKGSAFPTCVSVNHIVGHFSPLKSETAALKSGDLVKVDLGVHIDGYVVVAAHSFVCGSSPASPVSGKLGDVMHACNAASEAVLRLLKPGNTNSSVTDIITKISADYGVSAVAGVLSHNMQRFLLDGEKVILNRFDPEQQGKVESCEFAVGEIWSVDLVFSTGDGKPKEVDERTTVFKRNPETVYQLKLKASRAVLSEIDKKSPHFPFSIRNLDEEKKARVAVVECSQHGLLAPYPVLHEKDGEYVAHIKYTALITATGTKRITGLPFDFATYKTDKKASDVVKAVLNTSTKAGAAKKKTESASAASSSSSSTSSAPSQ